MSFRVNSYAIKKIDENNRTISFDTTKHGKITGSRLQAVLGRDRYTSEFHAACLISRIYSEFEPSKYTEAGEAIEPIIRNHVRNNSREFLTGRMGLSENDRISVEDPVPKGDCGYDHFKMNPVFGGMVDGYVRVNGSRRAILEIKTANDKAKWMGSDGKMDSVPENYMLQASLYAELADLDEIVFAVGFLEEEDYDNPKKWVPNEDNFAILRVIKKDISEEMGVAADWFEKYIKRGITPEWTAEDSVIVDRMLTKNVDFVPGDFKETVKKYLETRDPMLESQIKEKLSGMFGNSKSMVYSQNGFDFRLTKDFCGKITMCVEKSGS